MTRATDDALETAFPPPLEVTAPARGRWLDRVTPWRRDARAREARRTTVRRADAWLDVVTGPHPDRVARGALELAARALARGERVVILDASPATRLDARLACEPARGLVEVTWEGDAPLERARPTGAPECLLLAYGDRARRVRWAGLERVLDDLRPHVPHAILALAADAPREAGAALAGIPHAGWWAAPDVASRGARSFSGRQHIPLFDIELDPTMEPSLEGLLRRIRVLATPASRARLMRAAAPAAAPEAVPADAILASAPDVSLRLRGMLARRAARVPVFAIAPLPAAPPSDATTAVAEPPVLAIAPLSARPSAAIVAPRADAIAAPESATVPAAAPPIDVPSSAPPVFAGDPRVRDRLRFLAWMRSVQDEAAAAESR